MRLLFWMAGCLALLIGAAQAQGQTNRGLYGGVSAGAGEVPYLLVSDCRLSRPGNNARAAMGSVLVGVPVGPVRFEARTSRAVMTADDVDCPVLDQPIHEHGSFTSILPDFRSSSMTSSDVRLRVEGPRALPLMLAVGGGWLWTHDMPYATAATGVRTGRRLRWGVDVTWDYYRMPFIAYHSEWADFQVVRAWSDRAFEWQSAWSLRLAAEWQPR
jgi:hypothetical protein